MLLPLSKCIKDMECRQFSSVPLEFTPARALSFPYDLIVLLRAPSSIGLIYWATHMKKNNVLEHFKLTIVVHTYCFSSLEAEAGRSGVQGQAGLCEILSQITSAFKNNKLRVRSSSFKLYLGTLKIGWCVKQTMKSQNLN